MFSWKVRFYSVNRRYSIYNRCGVGKHAFIDFGGPKWGQELDSLSHSSKERLWRGRGAARIYMNFLLEEPLVKHKKIAANHKRQTSPVNDFNRFLYEWCRNLGSLKFSLGVHLNSLRCAFLFFSILSSYTPNPQGWAVAVGCSLILEGQEWPAAFSVLYKEKLKII